MRLDKYLKVSRIIKRRTVANEVCDAKHVTVNGKIASPGTKVLPYDKVCFGGKIIAFFLLTAESGLAQDFVNADGGRVGKIEAAQAFNVLLCGLHFFMILLK